MCIDTGACVLRERGAMSGGARHGQESIAERILFLLPSNIASLLVFRAMLGGQVAFAADIAAHMFFQGIQRGTAGSVRSSIDALNLLVTNATHELTHGHQLIKLFGIELVSNLLLSWCWTIVFAAACVLGALPRTIVRFHRVKWIGISDSTRAARHQAGMTSQDLALFTQAITMTLVASVELALAGIHSRQFHPKVFQSTKFLAFIATDTDD